MCSVNEDNLNGALSEQRPSKIITDPSAHDCKKCRAVKSELVLRGKDTYCKACFVAASLHKFRSTLGKNKRRGKKKGGGSMQPGRSRVLIGFHGNDAALSLLHLVSQGLSAQQNGIANTLVEHSVLVIDESGLAGGDKEEQRKVIECARTFDFPVYVVALEKAVSIDALTVDAIFNDVFEYPGEEETSRLQQALDCTAEHSAKETVLKQLRRRLLAKAATLLGMDRVYTAESATSLAVSLMSGIHNL